MCVISCKTTPTKKKRNNRRQTLWFKYQIQTDIGSNKQKKAIHCHTISLLQIHSKLDKFPAENYYCHWMVVVERLSTKLLSCAHFPRAAASARTMGNQKDIPKKRARNWATAHQPERRKKSNSNIRIHYHLYILSSCCCIDKDRDSGAPSFIFRLLTLGASCVDSLAPLMCFLVWLCCYVASVSVHSFSSTVRCTCTAHIVLLPSFCFSLDTSFAWLFFLWTSNEEN